MTRSTPQDFDQRKVTVLGRFSYGSIPMITHFVADAAKEAKLDEDAVFHCQMAVDEACTNIIEHAYAEDPNGNFEVNCWIEPGTLTIQIIDQGKKFDPTLAPTPQFSSDINQISPGGVGIHLIKKLMDEVRFEFTKQGNTLTLVKKSPLLIHMSASKGIPIREDKHGVWVVAPRGQVDSLVASDLDEVLSVMIKEGKIRVVVDLAEATYISSKGLKALVSAWRLARDSGGELVLCDIAPRVQSIVDTIGLNQVFAIYLDLNDAIRAIETEH